MYVVCLTFCAYTASQVDNRRVVATKLHSLYFRLFHRAQNNDDDIAALFDGMEALGEKLFNGTFSSMDKEQRFENLYGSSRPNVVTVHPPAVVKTKGSGSGGRIVSHKEKALREQQRPCRQCKKCGEFGHHDSRNCGREKDKAKK